MWHWEYPNGARVYTDGCFAPADMSDPIPVVDFRHDLHWIDADGNDVSYERDGEAVTGLAGRVELMLEGGNMLDIEAEGRWAQRYGPLGGGLSEMLVRIVGRLGGHGHLRGHRRPPSPLLPRTAGRAPPARRVVMPAPARSCPRKPGAYPIFGGRNELSATRVRPG